MTVRTRRGQRRVTVSRAQTKTGALAVAEQASSSAVSFAMTLALARWLPAAEFGAATLAIAFSLMAQALYRALVLEPATVLGPSRYRDDLDGYLRSVLRLHLGTTIPFAVLGSFLLGALALVELSSPLAASVGAALAGLPLILALPLARTIAYIKGRPSDCIAANLLYGGSLGAALLALRASYHLNAPTAMGAIGLTSGLGAMFMLRHYAIGAPIRGVALWRVHARYGGVIVAATATAVATNQLFGYITGATLGLEAVGALNALLTIGAPTLPALAALGSLFVPKMARAFAEKDDARVRHLARAAGLGAVGVAVMGATVVIAVAPLLERLAYGGKFQDNVGDLRLVALYPIATALSLRSSLILRAEQNNRHYLQNSLVVLPTTILAAVILQPRFGFRGAVIGLLLTACVSAMSLELIRWRWDRGSLRRRLDLIVGATDGFRSARLRQALPTLVVLTAGTCSFVATMAPALATGVIVAAVVALAVLARTRWSTGVIAFAWSVSLVHLFKRAIYLFGDQPRLTYVAIVAIPGLLVTVVAVKARVVRGTSSVALVALLMYAIFSAASGLLQGGETSLPARAAGLLVVLTPLAAYRVGLAMPIDGAPFKRFVSAFSLSALVSVPYGLWLLLAGPSPIERSWASSLHETSIQARKVYNHIHNLPGGEWRGFSYHADPFAWGLYLVVGLFLFFAGRAVHRRGWTVSFPAWLVVGAFLLGLFASLSRSPWLGAVAAAGMFAILGLRPARRPMIVYASAIVGLVVVLNVGSFLYQQVFPQVHIAVREQNQVVARYLNLGSVEARIGAWEQLPKALAANPILGQGRGRALEQQQVGQGDLDLTQISHNFLVEIALLQGGVALFAQLIFLATVVRSGVRLSRYGTPESVRVGRVIVSLIFGLVMTGYTNGGLFLNETFFVLCGVIAATDRRFPGQGVSRPSSRQVEIRGTPANPPISTKDVADRVAIAAASQ